MTLNTGIRIVSFGLGTPGTVILYYAELVPLYHLILHAYTYLYLALLLIHVKEDVFVHYMTLYEYLLVDVPNLSLEKWVTFL
ncbi:hypothetical protein BV22DRAFT_1038313 [Leucogyrophana mollusca]|uniref:Uncharacterized protein n=1 Tax=Leucogyrophana mollusca TaxID=85980 RepID=A0ACB8B9V6_9AGAM|nr:hypothetical protein BV22DRAFT_1038313 [Leucogyrophana mollusca]